MDSTGAERRAAGAATAGGGGNRQAGTGDSLTWAGGRSMTIAEIVCRVLRECSWPRTRRSLGGARVWHSGQRDVSERIEEVLATERWLSAMTGRRRQPSSPTKRAKRRGEPRPRPPRGARSRPISCVAETGTCSWSDQRARRDQAPAWPASLASRDRNRRLPYGIDRGPHRSGDAPAVRERARGTGRHHLRRDL